MDDDDDPIRAEAKRRHNSHTNHPSHRPLSEGYELAGLRGEEALVAEFGGWVDLQPRPGGDGGVDALIDTVHGIFRIDVKAARKPYNLIVEVGKVERKVIYVLGYYSDADDKVTLLGWEWGIRLLEAPTRDFGHGVINHFIKRAKLRKLAELHAVRVS